MARSNPYAFTAALKTGCAMLELNDRGGGADPCSNTPPVLGHHHTYYDVMVDTPDPDRIHCGDFDGGLGLVRVHLGEFRTADGDIAVVKSQEGKMWRGSVGSRSVLWHATGLSEKAGDALLREIKRDSKNGSICGIAGGDDCGNSQ
jgi:hypothetical protein